MLRRILKWSLRDMGNIDGVEPLSTTREAP
jgi:hypothetical protein